MVTLLAWEGKLYLQIPVHIFYRSGIRHDPEPCNSHAFLETPKAVVGVEFGLQQKQVSQQHRDTWFSFINQGKEALACPWVCTVELVTGKAQGVGAPQAPGLGHPQRRMRTRNNRFGEKSWHK